MASKVKHIPLGTDADTHVVMNMYAIVRNEIVNMESVTEKFIIVGRYFIRVMN